MSCLSTCLSCSSKVLEIPDFTEVSSSSFTIIPVLMFERSLKVLLFAFFILVIMTLELCLCSVGVFTSCFLFMED